MGLIDSEMVGSNGLKLGGMINEVSLGMIEGICENVLIRFRGGMIHDSLF